MDLTPPPYRPDFTGRILIVDDHDAVLQGLIPTLKNCYPQATFDTAKDRLETLHLAGQIHYDLIIIDLCIPDSTNPNARDPEARVNIGLRLLESLMGKRPCPNLFVLSSYLQPLVRLKQSINVYGGGFSGIEKSESLEKALPLIDLSLQGAVHLPIDLRSRITFEPSWLQLLSYRFEEGLTDRAIAKIMGVSDRTVRNYWIRIQNCLDIPDEPGKDSRIKIEMEARRLGLIS